MISDIIELYSFGVGLMEAAPVSHLQSPSSGGWVYSREFCPP